MKQSQMQKKIRQSVDRLLKKHANWSASRVKEVGYATEAERKRVIRKGFDDLIRMGYGITEVSQFKGRHMQALVDKWREEGKPASTIQTWISHFRVMANVWLGKEGMLRRSEYYVPPGEEKAVRRQYVARDDKKTWSGQGLTPEAIMEKLRQVAEMDPRCAIQLEMQLAFGMRVKESALIKPHLADKGEFLAVNWGTKGGRDRVVPVEEAVQRDVIARAKQFAREVNDSIVPKDKTLIQWRNHYYYILRKAGITRKDGLVSHGLRHEYANKKYEEIAGVPSRIKGGDIKQADPRRVALAKHEISERLGHSRTDVTRAYTGTNQV